MGLLDTLKARLAPAKGKVGDLAKEHGDKIEHGLDKAAKTVDEKTKGKYSDKIRTGTGKAKDALDRLAAGSDSGPSSSPGQGPGSPGQGTPPAAGGTPTPPAS
ncbi:antitoxin [Streptomyces sp. NPDC050418]|uniref:antitoxin n=1 Tax=Streptomyces sp. NPDC050418 TaxID=3365612 RepID=UPI0037920B83